ncbi:MAG: hypothetical protein ACLU0O_05395 [Collinsella sp.]
MDADATPLGTSVVTGTGNNGDDGFEGLIYKGVIGTYLQARRCPRTRARRLVDRPCPRAPWRCTGCRPAAAQAPRRHLRARRPRRRHEAPPSTSPPQRGQAPLWWF